MQPIQIQTAASVLQNIEIFRPLPPMLRSEVAKQLVPVHLADGELLFEEGDEGDAMFIIASGQVAIFRTDKTLGLTFEVARLGAGQAFGEMSLITNAPRSASVRAAEPTQLFQLSRGHFEQLVMAAPRVALTIAAVLAGRLETLNRSQGIEFGTLRGKSLESSVMEIVPLSMVTRHRMVPVEAQGNVVTLATPDPTNTLGLDDFRRVLRDMQIQVLAVSEADYNAFANAHLTQQKPGSGLSRQSAPAPNRPRNVVYHGPGGRGGSDPKLAAAPQADVGALLSAIIAEGVERGAADIHIEPDRSGVKVRYRVDGRLQFREGIIPMSVHPPLLSRLKVVAQLDITEKRLPLEGRISLDIDNIPYDLRVATVHTRYGEKATLRILDSSKVKQDLGALIVHDKVVALLRKILSRTSGLLLVTGPTASGKTTTMYGCLAEKLSPEVAICTIEDPIEYDLQGVTQVQVNEQIGLGFNTILRTYLRMTPDVIMVGETRDPDTATLCCNAALTGHLVLTSLHTKDAISAVARLRGLGVEPFLLANSLLGVINQRLVRRICPACRVEAEYPDLVLKNLDGAGVRLSPGAKLYKGPGCRTCNGEGYKGQVGVYEMLFVNNEVAEAIGADVPAADLRELARGKAYMPMASYAAYLLERGLTQPSEILRILHRDKD